MTSALCPIDVKTQPPYCFDIALKEKLELGAAYLWFLDREFETRV
jgi:hypothetical protein